MKIVLDLTPAEVERMRTSGHEFRISITCGDTEVLCIPQAFLTGTSLWRPAGGHGQWNGPAELQRLIPAQLTSQPPAPHSAASPSAAEPPQLPDL